MLRLTAASGVTKMVPKLLTPVARSLALMNGDEAPAVLVSVAVKVCVPASAAVNV
jgi:hypothetical protein